MKRMLWSLAFLCLFIGGVELAQVKEKPVEQKPSAQTQQVKPEVPPEIGSEVRARFWRAAYEFQQASQNLQAARGKVDSSYAEMNAICKEWGLEFDKTSGEPKCSSIKQKR